ncbi:hypothetical protein RhiirA4_399696 [Rhizophagus irregularis]|uniref:Uncharacterized protein n=1 Tax=Rhizophagus irregularis TaxID=588596 RepID=A0A2I1GCC9_9GLOM|nr:hypothetical protein RhiirA4_399696 [Rhizophagus irregularis]
MLIQCISPNFYVYFFYKNSITNLHSTKYCLLNRKEINNHIVDWVWWDLRTVTKNTIWKNIHNTHFWGGTSIIQLIIPINANAKNTNSYNLNWLVISVYIYYTIFTTEFIALPKIQNNY